MNNGIGSERKGGIVAIRDMQRSRVYKAEEWLKLHYGGTTGRSVRVLQPYELQAFVDNIVGRSYWKNTANVGQPITLKEAYHRQTQNGCVPQVTNYAATIYIDSGHQTKLDVLHSMAHLMRGKTPIGDVHDAQFAKYYIELVRRFFNGYIDEDFKRVFKKALIDHGVKTKVVSAATREKQRDAYIARMTPTPEDLVRSLREIEEI